MKQSSDPCANQLTMAITELDFGGAERAFVQLAIGLKSRGWIIRVISLRDAGPLAEPLRQAGISVEALQCGGAGDFRAIRRMKLALLRHRPAVLLTFLHQANIVGRLAAKRAGVKTVVCGVRVADRRWAMRIPEWLTKQHVTHYVAVSRSVGTVHRDLCGLAAEKIETIYNGVDMQKIAAAAPVSRRELQCNDDDQVILCVGRLCPQKAPLDVIAAFDELRRLDPTGHARRKLVFVGNGPAQPAVEKLITKKRLEDHVRLLGWRTDVASIMKAATVLVLASKWEGLPNVIFESQAAGLPVVASAVDGCVEVIDDGQTGRLFPPGDTLRLAHILKELLVPQIGNIDAPRETRARLATQARAFAARFSWEKCVAEYDGMLRKLQSAESAPSPPPDQ
ncbi:MAG: glycosyltransferase [Planctomycetota bacterium]|nr:MAG: glycosyltransferase [Planctomycetota bacterium]